jgi:hypothetical protein
LIVKGFGITSFRMIYLKRKGAFKSFGDSAELVRDTYLRTQHA